MSHLCVVQTILKDPDALARACQRLGWQMRQGGKVRYYNGPADECDYTIELLGETSSYGYELATVYNLGIKRQEDGTYSILCDNAMGTSQVEYDTNKQIGETPRILNTLRQAYSYAVLEAEAAMQGMVMGEPTIRDDGTMSFFLEVA